MKALRFLLILAVVAVALGASQGSVYALAFTYTSGFQVQNLESGSSTIGITFYNQDGTTAGVVNDTIPGSGSKTYFPLTSVPDGFNGSAVISATTQVAAVSNVLGNNGVAAASYVASSGGNTEVLLPLLMQNNAGFNTWFSVQNTGSGDATVDVSYSDGTSVNNVVIPEGASHTYDQSLESHSANVFSAVITSDKPVAAAVIEESSSVMFAYSGFNSGSTNPVLPLINANNSGYITGVQIQNAGTSSTNVTVSYTPSTAGTACTETQSIPAGQSRTFALGAFAGSPPAGATTNCVGGQTFVGSAQITGNTNSQELVAIVNQLKSGVNGEAYGSFDPTTATSTVVLPLIMDRNGGYFTGFNVMNVGGSSTTVTCEFTGTSYEVMDTLAAGEALNDLQSNKIASGYVGSATCTASGSGSIVAVVNELGASASADQLLVYEGITP